MSDQGTEEELFFIDSKLEFFELKNSLASIVLCTGILSIFSFPYLRMGFRLDQILIPITVSTFIILYGLHRKVLNLLFFSLSILILVPMLLMLVRINLQGYSFSTQFLIRELQNILKMPIYMLFGYFVARFVPEKVFMWLVKMSILLIFFFAIITTALSYLKLPAYNELVSIYRIHPYAAIMGRFPGILNQPATAGMFFAVMSYILLLHRSAFSFVYFLMILSVGILATSKVFVFSIPFIILAYLLMKRFNSQEPSKPRRRRKLSWVESLSYSLTTVAIIYLLFIFSEIITNSFNYLSAVIQNDPLAGRDRNFVADYIPIILAEFPFFGIGFAVAEEFSQTATSGTWDSMLLYDLYFYGLIGMILKGLLITKIFVQTARNKPELIILSIMLLNLYASGLGFPVFGQERIGDFLWIFIGFKWTRRRIYTFRSLDET